MQDIIPIFPIPVMHVKGLIPEPRCRQLLSRLEERDWEKNAHNSRLGHTTIAAHEGEALSNELDAHIQPKLAELGLALFGEVLTWSIKESWMNVLETGGAQAMHAHANSVISGVVYLTASDPSANLVFHRPTGGREFILSNFHEGAELNIYNAPRRQTGPIDAGDVILFPSYLLHSVPENKGGRRVSMAFNAIPNELNAWGYKLKLSG